MLMYSIFKIGVRSGILLSRDRAVHFIAQRNPDEIKYVKIPLSFYCKKMFDFDILVQNGTSAFPQSLSLGMSV